MQRGTVMKTSPTPLLPEERPRERCLSQGARCLSLRECLAVVFGSGPTGQGALGLAHSVLSKSGDPANAMEQESAFFTALEAEGTAHLHGVRGLGDAHRARVLAAFEIGRRYANFRDRTRVRNRPKRRPHLLASHALELIDAPWKCEPKEWLGFVPVFRNGQPGPLCIVERGARTHVNTEPAELFARVLSLRPIAFFLFHNHPSGDLDPSPQDFDLTERVHRLAKQLGVPLLGHGIVSPRGERWIMLYEGTHAEH